MQEALRCCMRMHGGAEHVQPGLLLSGHSRSSPDWRGYARTGFSHDVQTGGARLSALCIIRVQGVPVIEAPGEAEAQCAQLCKENLVSWRAWDTLCCISWTVSCRADVRPSRVATVVCPAADVQQMRASEERFARSGAGLLPARHTCCVPSAVTQFGPNGPCASSSASTTTRLSFLQVYGISTEDMDSLTFGTPRLIRHLMAPVAQKLDAMEFDHAKVGAGGWAAVDGMVVFGGVWCTLQKAQSRAWQGAAVRRVRRPEFPLQGCLARQPCLVACDGHSEL